MSRLLKAITTALFVAGVSMLPAMAEQNKQPNIVLIMADDLGFETLGANGGTSYQTPHLDRLASQGVRFEHAYAQPLCTPTRVKLLTGQSNARNYEVFGRLPRHLSTFAQVLHANGYKTCIAGKWQLGNEKDAPQHFGFDEALLWQHTRHRTRNGTEHDSRYPNPLFERNGKPVDYLNGEYGPEVLTDFICDFIVRHKDQPFLAYYPMLLPHCPFEPTPDSKTWDPKDMGALKYHGDGDDAEKQKNFADMVFTIDRLVQQIVDTLEEQGLRENTIVIFTGDNGTDSPIVSMCLDKKIVGGKGRMTDAGTRVPLIASWPGTLPSGAVREDLVDFSDFYPTLLEVAGLKAPEQHTLDGVSFLSAAKGVSGPRRKYAYCWYNPRGDKGKSANNTMTWARTQDYKLNHHGKFEQIFGMGETHQVLELNGEQRTIRAELQKVLDKYASLRDQTKEQKVPLTP